MSDNKQSQQAGQARAWFYEFGPTLTKLGYNIVPAIGKIIPISDWVNWRPQDGDYELYANHNIGLLTKWTPALDVDVPDPEAAKALYERLRARFPWLKTGRLRVGRSPKFAILCRTDKPFPKRKVRLQKGTLKVGIEWLGDGQQIIGYGIHPDTRKAYTWIKEGIENTPVTALPLVTADLADEVLHEAEIVLRSLAYSAVQIETKEAKGVGVLGMSVMPYIEGMPTWAMECLSRLNAADYDTWVRVGHILKAASENAPWAYDAWVGWSQSAPNYQSGDEDRWNTFKPSSIGNPEHALKIAAGLKEDPMAGFDKEPPAPPADPFDFSDIHLRKLKDFPFIVPGLIPRGVPTLLSAHGGAGKSYISLQLAIAAAAGLDYLGRKIAPSKVLVYSCEEPEHELALRVQRILLAMMLTPADLGGRLHILNGYGKSNNIFFTGSRNVEERLTGKYWEFLDYCKAEKFDLVIVDNISEVFDANEIERAMVRQFVQSMNAVCKWIGCGLLLIGHVDAATSVGKLGKGYSGSTAWHNSVRSRLFLYPTETKGIVVLEPSKSNYGPPQPAMQLTFNTDTKIWEMTGTVETKKQAPVEEAAVQMVMRALVKLKARNVTVTTATGPNASGMAVLAKELEIDRPVVGAVLTELLRRAWIEKTTIKTGQRKQATVWEITPLGQVNMVNEDDGTFGDEAKGGNDDYLD